jgi:glycosyltransferase involved in cell wall biosynthesis
MKITYITMLWPAASETFATRDMKALLDQGHDINVIGLRPDFHKEKSSYSIPSTRMNLKNQIKGFLFVIIYLNTLIKLLIELVKLRETLKNIFKSVLLFPAVALSVSKIENNKPDIVHLFWGHFPSMVAWCMRQRGLDIPITQFLGPYDLSYNYKLSSVVAHDADMVFTHTPDNIKVIEKMGVAPEKIKCIFRGIDVVDIASTQKQSNSFIFVGRLTKAKGIFEMIDAFERIHNATPSSFLTIIGDGEDRKKLENYIKQKKLSDAVHLKGWMKPDDVLETLSSHQIMLFLSHSERLPNAVKEAMMMGVIPISSKTIGIETLIEHDHNGYIVHHDNDPQDIVNITINLLNNDKKRNDMADSARKAIIDTFDVKQSMQRYSDIWTDILDKKKR